LIKDYDDVALYDKTDYYSDSTRQSFVVDNETGLIYKIENTNIANLSGGCVKVKDNPYPFDMRINSNGELQFFSLYQNPAITSNYCIKDKFGAKYINNNRLNEFDPQTNTNYFVTNHLYSNGPYSYYGLSSSSEFGKSIAYFLTSSGDIVKTSFGSYNWLQYQISDTENIYRSLNSSDNFEIYTHQHNQNHIINKTIVRNGLLYSYLTLKESLVNNGTIKNKNIFLNFGGWPTNNQTIVIQNENIHSYYPLNITPPIFSTNNNWQQNFTSIKFLDKHSIMLFYSSGKVFYYKNFWKNYLKVISEFSSSTSWSTTSVEGNILNFYSLTNVGNYNETMSYFEADKVEIPLLDNSTVESHVWGGVITKIGLQGNVTYELIPEFTGGEWKIVPYIEGSYTAPPTTTITLQPINR
jgi:hypothetical protein